MEQGMDRKYLDKLRPQLENQYGAARADKILTDAWKRYGEICAENADEPKKMHMHTRKRIYPACAAFDALVRNGIDRQEAADFLNGCCLRRAEPMGERIRRIMKLPGLYRLVPGFFGKMTKSAFGETAGFRSKWYPSDKSEIRFDMLACPYYDKCVEYGCPEIVAGFCRLDDVCYGNMHPKLRWGRTKTLGLGGDCCDFKVTVVK